MSLPLVLDGAVGRLPQLGGVAASAGQVMRDEQIGHRRSITAYGEDMSRILEGKWDPPAGA